MKTQFLFLVLTSLLYQDILFSQSQQGSEWYGPPSGDTKTFMYKGLDMSVKQYLINEIERKTVCCGKDRIYLEVGIAPSGRVISSRAITGKSECLKRAAVDAVYKVSWDMTGYKRTRFIYFEIKPDIPCEQHFFVRGEIRSPLYRADPTSLQFEQSGQQVSEYILNQLEDWTTCRGRRQLQLAITINQTGKVTDIQELGHPAVAEDDCFLAASIDIIHQIWWLPLKSPDPAHILLELDADIPYEKY